MKESLRLKTSRKRGRKEGTREEEEEMKGSLYEGEEGTEEKGRGEKSGVDSERKTGRNKEKR